MDPGYFDTVRQQSPRETANVFSKIFYLYTLPLFAKGRKGQLSISDMYRVSPMHKATPRGDVLAQKWKEELAKKDSSKKPSLLRSIIKVHGLQFIIVNVLFSFVDTALRLTIPLCLEGLIKYFSPNTQVTKEEAYLYATGVCLFMFVNACLMNPMLLFLLDLSLKVRVACCSLIYRKLLRLDLTAGGKASEGLTGHVINLLTTDAQRFDMASLFLVDLVRAPIESTLIVYLMYRQIGVATLVGVAFLLLFIPLQGYLGKISSKLRRKTAMRTDNRIRLMNEVIQSIESIKMYAWENAFAGIIGKARRKEMNVIKKMSWLRAVMISCVKLNTKVAIFLSIISFLSLKNDLTAAKVFVIFSYYEMMKYTLVDFLPLAITFTLEAYVSIKRMQEFLLLPEVVNSGDIDLVQIDDGKKATNGVFEKIGNGQQAYIKSETNLEQPDKPQYLIQFKNYSAHWNSTEDDGVDKKTPALVDINFVVKPGTLTTIIGQVGSGKSSLLLAILRELSTSEGELVVSGTVAYGAQEPWLFEASVRQNILFGQEYEPRRYKQVIKCCQLKSDLEILPNGDKTIVGERGASLSGGQRARISLARCVYQEADVYLLDDPLAAVDAKVATAIYNECIRSYLRDKAVLLVTHHVNFAKQADNTIVMRNAKIVAQGTYQELRSGVTEFEKLVEMGERIEELKKKQKAANYENQESVVYSALVLQENQRTDAIRSEHSQRFRSQRSMSEASQLSFNLDLDNNLDPKYEGEVQHKGSVDNSVYLAYIRSGGGRGSMFILLMLFLLAQVFYASTDVWLKEWVNLEEAHSAANIAARNANVTAPVNIQELPTNRFGLTREQCVYVYASLIVICILFTWNKLVVFYNTCIRASTNLHDTMFRGVTNAPMWFFHHNPSGRILNRFSKDMGQVDTLLPVALVDCLGFFLEVVSILVVVCVVNWWLLIPTAVIACFLMLLRDLFLNTSRELKRIEAIARSQSLNHAAATISGLTTIRSTRSQQRPLAREFDKLQDLHSLCWSPVLLTNRAFGLWMDMVCCVYLAAVAFSFLFFTGDESNRGGDVGLAITQVIGLVGMCQFGMRQTAEVENQMTSVERILEYTNLPPETPLEIEEEEVRKNLPNVDLNKWPEKGEVIFENVSLEYEKPPKANPSSGDTNVDTSKTPEPTYALRDVCLTLSAGEKVAVVGRTGAGKSSLIAALFGLSKTSGTISIDGATSDKLGLRRWRRGVGALPQRAALFAATLRDNLDPTHQHADAEIYRAVHTVELDTMISSLPHGLTSKIGDGGGNLSAGQRQLVCLARCSLARTTVLALDEATANVDSETDKLIQNTIRTKFADSTVLTIAHRLNTVMDYDRVIVMDKGRIVETGHPYELLTQGQNKTDAQPRRSLLSKSQAPLAIPENFTFDPTTPPVVEEPNETLLLGRDRVRTYSNKSEPERGEGGYFKSLVEQTGRDNAALLYELAELSYKKMLENKKKS